MRIDKEYENDKANSKNQVGFVKNFLWLCSGADIDILLLKDCETERNKYASIGATLFFTAVMGFLSGSYALYTVFRSLLPATALGFLWSILLFNLDRSIVLSIKKSKDSFWRPLFSSIPSFILSAALGIIIAKPLELQLFSREISYEIEQAKNEKLLNARQEIRENGTAEIKAAEQRVIRVEEAISDKNVEIGNQNDNLTAAIVERGNDLGAQNRQRQIEQLQEDVSSLESSLEMFEEELDNAIDDAYEVVDAQIESEYASSDGFPKQFEILEDLASENERISTIRTAITILFILIELLPIVVKLISKYGPYNAVVDAKEEMAFSRQEAKLANMKDKIGRNRKDNQIVQDNVSLLLTNEFVKIIEQALSKREYITAINSITKNRIENTLNNYSTFIDNEINSGLGKEANLAVEHSLEELDDEVEKQEEVRSRVVNALELEAENLKNQYKEAISSYDREVEQLQVLPVVDLEEPDSIEATDR